MANIAANAQYQDTTHLDRKLNAQDGAHVFTRNSVVPQCGFNFDLVKRNQVLMEKGLKMPKAMSRLRHSICSTFVLAKLRPILFVKAHYPTTQVG